MEFRQEVTVRSEGYLILLPPVSKVLPPVIPPISGGGALAVAPAVAHLQAARENKLRKQVAKTRFGRRDFQGPEALIT